MVLICDTTEDGRAIVMTDGDTEQLFRYVCLSLYPFIECTLSQLVFLKPPHYIRCFEKYIASSPGSMPSEFMYAS